MNTIFYIEYLNKDKGFTKDKITFNTHEEAIKWGRENLGNFHSDMIQVSFEEEVTQPPVGFIATIKYKDTDEELSGIIFKVGAFDEEEATEEEKRIDEDVFYYLQDAKEIEQLTKEGAIDFWVLDYEPIYQF